MFSVEVEIFGRKYKLKGDDPKKLFHIAETLDKSLIELSSEYEALEFNKLLMLCALLQQEQIMDLTNSNQELKDELDRMNQLISAFIPDTGDN